MALKNRDGTVYKLRGPNPLMEEQTKWENFQIHNMKFQGEVAADERQVDSIKSDFNVRDDFVESLEATKPAVSLVQPAKPEPVAPVVPVPVAPVVPPTPVVEQAPSKPAIQLPPGVKKVGIYCLPATLRDRRDGVYGSQYQTIQYGKPFLFEGVIYKEEDLFIQIWTPVVELGSGSIIYPRKSDAEGKSDAGRWWRIQDKEPKTGGWLMKGYPSDYTPSFEGVG